MRTRHVVIIVFLVAAGLLVWFLMGESDEHEPASTAKQEEAKRPTPPQPAAGPALVGRAVPLPAVPNAPVPPLPVSGPASADTEGESWIVRGVLHGLDAALGGRTRVVAHPVHHVFVNLDVRVEGSPFNSDRFELDVTELFTGERPPTYVEVVVDHPAYAKVRERIDVAQATGDSPRVLAFEGTLRRAHALTGVVLDRQGGPVVGASVALFAMKAGKLVFSNIEPIQPVDSTATDEQGHYRLRGIDAASFLVVARAKGLRPAARQAARPRHADAELEPLVLRHGVAVEGRVSWVGHPVAGANVTAGVVEGLWLQVGPARVSWLEGGGVTASGETDTDEDGHYRIEGLSPRTYVIGYGGGELPGIDFAAPMWSELTSREVVAPAADVDLAVQGVHLRLQVESAGVPLPGALVTVARRGSFMTLVTGEDGVLDVLLAPEDTSTVRVQSDGYAETTVDVKAGPSETRLERTVRIEPAVDCGAIVLVFEGEDAAELAVVYVIYHHVDFPASRRPPELDWLRKEGGPFRLGDLTAGTYVLKLEPGRGLIGPSGYFLPSEHRVEVLAGGEARLAVDVQIGGRLRIAARDEAGGLLDAECDVRDEYGESQLVAFHAQDGTSTTSGPKLGCLSASLVDPPLPPGAYTVELSMDGRESRTLDVEVKKHETMDVDVVLPALR